MELRSATNEGADAVRELVFGILAEFGLVPDPGGTDADLDDIVGNYGARGGRFDVLVAADGVIAGCVGLYPLREGVVELRKMYLRPKYRGAGAGRRLFDHALAPARELGFRRMELETSSKLMDAVRMYERFGFRPIEACRAAARCDAKYDLELWRRGNLAARSNQTSERTLVNRRPRPRSFRVILPALNPPDRRRNARRPGRLRVPGRGGRAGALP